MQAPFRSKLIKSFDYKKADLSSFCEPFEPDEEALAESFEFIRKKYAKLENVSAVEKGDFAEISCSSEIPKFNKEKVNLCVGKNLYSKELEEQLIGLKAGDSATLTVDGKDVSVTVKSISRNVLPEITDEFVNSTFISLSTVEDLRNWYINEQFNEHVTVLAEDAANAITDETVKKSDIVLDEEERLALRRDGERILREHWLFNGIDLDKMTDEEAEETFGYPSVAAYINWFADLSERDISTALLGFELMGKTFTDEEYREELKRNAEEAKMSEEELAKQFTFAAFVRQKCSEYYTETLKNHAYEYIKERLK